MMSPSAMSSLLRPEVWKRPPANYGTSATIPRSTRTRAPTRPAHGEDDDEALARPPRSKMEAFGVKATADALENLIRDAARNSRAMTAR